MKNNAAFYITDKEELAKAKPRKRRSFTTGAFSFVAILALVLAVGTSFASSSLQAKKADAGFPELLCNNIGYGMTGQLPWTNPFVSLSNDTQNRDITAEEAFAASLHFTAYSGDDNGSAFGVVNQTKTKFIPAGSTSSIPFYSDVYSPYGSTKGYSGQPALSSKQTAFNCLGDNLTIPVADAFLQTSTVFTSLASWVSDLAFNSSIVCQHASGNTGSCFNLLKVVGGPKAHYTCTPSGCGASGGLIGELTSSIYFPLLALVALLVGAWVAYKGIVQRRLREAFFGVAWCLFAVIFGAAFLLNPGQLAEAPTNVSDALATCVIESFNGTSCLATAGGSSSTSYDNNNQGSNVCWLDTQGESLGQQAETSVDELNCNIWKAFVLEPWAEGQFGTSFEGLNTAGADTSQPAVTGASSFGSGAMAHNFCINLHPTSTLSSLQASGSGLTLSPPGSETSLGANNNTECNIGLYQMFLMTDASWGGTGNCATVSFSGADAGCILGTQASDGVSSGVNLNWYAVIGAIYGSKSTSMFNDYSASSTESHMISEAILALLTAGMGCVVIIVISVFAIMYQLIAAIMIALAPLFFLIGVHPGRGRDILKGFGELILTNIMKYFASALYLIVVIALYGGVLGDGENPALTFVFVMVLSFAMFLYRKEIVELLGRVDMGGRKLSNFSSKVSQSRVGKFGKKMGQATMAGVGGAIGASMAGGEAVDGFRDQVRNDLRRGKGMFAAGVRGYEGGGRRNQDELDKAAEEANKNATRAQQAAEEAIDLPGLEATAVEIENSSNAVATADAGVELAEQDLETADKEVDELAQKVEDMEGALQELIEKEFEGEEKKEDFLEILKNQGEIDSLQKRLEDSDLDLSPVEREELKNEQKELLSTNGGLAHRMGSDLGRLQAKYDDLAAGVAVTDDEGNTRMVSVFSDYDQAVKNLKGKLTERNQLAEDYHQSVGTTNEARDNVLEAVDSHNRQVEEANQAAHLSDQATAEQQAHQEIMAGISPSKVLTSGEKEDLEASIKTRTAEILTQQRSARAQGYQDAAQAEVRQEFAARGIDLETLPEAERARQEERIQTLVQEKLSKINLEDRYQKIEADVPAAIIPKVFEAREIKPIPFAEGRLERPNRPQPTAPTSPATGRPISEWGAQGSGKTQEDFQNSRLEAERARKLADEYQKRIDEVRAERRTLQTTAATSPDLEHRHDAQRRLETLNKQQTELAKIQEKLAAARQSSAGKARDILIEADRAHRLANSQPLDPIPGQDPIFDPDNPNGADQTQLF